MNGPSHPPLSTLAQTIRDWAPVAVILLGVLATWFGLVAKVERLEMQNADWRQQHLQALGHMSAALDREQTQLRALTIDVARLGTMMEGIREELRRQGARQERIEQERGQAPREAR
jgi:hypothetical protein